MTQTEQLLQAFKLGIAIEREAIKQKTKQCSCEKDKGDCCNLCA